MPEILAKIKIPNKRPLISFKSAKEMFNFSKSHVAQYRQKEFDQCWTNISAAKDKEINEHWFFREYLWVVYVAGFSAQTISKKYEQLLIAHQIEDREGNYVQTTHENCYFGLYGGYDDVFAVFKNKRKARSIQECRLDLHLSGWDIFHSYYLKERDPKKLDDLPGVGPALACHLARNLGNVNVCKPDVHLMRLAAHYNLDSVDRLCRALSRDPVGKTDLILWLASVDNGTT